MSKYIIGDCHGCFSTLLALISKIKAAGGSLSDIVLVGDLVDRGPDSAAVVEFVKVNGIPCVKGNHEQMFIDWADKNEYQDGIWEMNGGSETLASYGFNGALLKEHVEFLRALPYYLEFPEEKNAAGQYLFVSHAGVSLNSQLMTGSLKDAITHSCEGRSPDIYWGRLEIAEFPEIFQVIGHTPKKLVEITEDFANVDTGCVFNRSGFTNLTALKFPEMEIIQQSNVETKGYPYTW